MRNSTIDVLFYADDGVVIAGEDPNEVQYLLNLYNEIKKIQHADYVDHK
jgi:hypothetical protein